MNAFLLGSGIAMAAIWAIHTFAGQVRVARPLTDCGELVALPKWTTFYCWHLVTITLGAMAAGLLYAAYTPSARDLAVAIGVLALLFGLFGLVLPRAVKQTYTTLPQGFLLFPVGVAVLWGVFG